MTTLFAPELPALIDLVRNDGYAFVTHDAMGGMLERDGGLADWATFAASWNDLAPDTYLAAHGRYRRRRHATYSALAGQDVTPEPHQAHFQALTYNRLQGDLQRWFEPMTPETASTASLGTILRFCHHAFGTLAPQVPRWHIEVHQFRIEASADSAGEPTPEGSHRDGVDYVLVLLIDRHNIASGTTTIHTPDGQLLGDFTLTRPLDAALVDDPRVFHGVTPVTPLDNTQPAHRDVLVVTFRASDIAEASA
ncbi:hypothetical protein FHW69_002673 [Luteibacter sp. Sphag1AF]|uniref:2OG-Fe dioxygenase family protein n=1 Tax=Luteibacter sp. Sphag1AF TaxID=2587031 RepID=UPI00161B8209|nr:2OG-Fe dioxygenase family protein [Luteibacter sp. Sphag1AF]MBB3228038.1 hypothetical protein [Luteibacter sp. Sphag1AF]